MSQEQPNDTEPHDPTPFHSMTSYTTLVPSKRRKQNSASEDEKAPDGVAEDVTSMILSVWKHSNTSDTDDSIDVETAISATTAIFNEKIQGIIRMGLDAFYRAESLSTKCAFLQEEVQQKTNENERLRAAEEKNKASLSVRNCVVLFIISYILE